MKQKSDFKIIIACEESQTICIAFREFGFELPIEPTGIEIYDSAQLPKEERRKARSKTFDGIAQAIAMQWGSFLLNGY